MNLEDSLASVDVGIAYNDLTVKASRSEKRGVEYVGTVGRGDEDNALVYAEAVHLYEQLVKRLLAFVVAAAETCASLSADGVDLVDKDNAGRVLLRLVKEVADTRRTYADEHLYKIRTRNREERYACLARDCAREKGFTCSGRAYEQYALGNAGT